MTLYTTTINIRIVSLLGEGFTPKEIARTLNLSKWAVYKRIERRIRPQDVLDERRKNVQKCPTETIEIK